MEFEWDRNRARGNERKHGVSFEEATEVFADEDRFVIFGKTYDDRFLVVAFTERNDRIRIISARPMTRREHRAYEQ